jgi:hypothetical protein
VSSHKDGMSMSVLAGGLYIEVYGSYRIPSPVSGHNRHTTLFAFLREENVFSCSHETERVAFPASLASGNDTPQYFTPLHGHTIKGEPSVSLPE